VGFDLASVPRGSKERLSVDGLPLMVVRGAQAGPRLGVTAAIHGDEFEGPAALFRFFDAVDAAELRGSIVAMPVANPAAFFAISRTHPEDGANLARVFPGAAEGTASQRLAWAISQHVIEGSDFFLDLHTGGVRYAMPAMAGYYTGDARSMNAALAFGAPVVWGHPVIPPGRTLSRCLELGIPFLYTEGAGGGRVNAQDATMFERGLWNLCAHLAMLPARNQVAPPALHLYGDGNVDGSENAPVDGFFVPSIELLDRVTPGQCMGRLLHLDGSLAAEVRAQGAGVVALLRMCPSVRAGEPLYLLASDRP